MTTHRRAEDKPKILFSKPTHEWECVGDGKVAYGASPKAAYFAWVNYLPPARNDFGARY
jgi:hypothetical protein